MTGREAAAQKKMVSPGFEMMVLVLWKLLVCPEESPCLFHPEISKNLYSVCESYRCCKYNNVYFIRDCETLKLGIGFSFPRVILSDTGSNNML